MEAFHIVSAEFPRVKLVLSTGKEVQFERIAALIDPQTMVITGKVSINDQIVLYSGALLFVITSLYEGFGFPPLEAMACGTPVISSDSGSLPEVVGETGILLDGNDSAGLALKIKDVLSSEELQNRMKKAGIERSRKFTKEKYSANLYRLFLGIHRK